LNPFLAEEERKAISDINVVPLADVSLVLLIILLVLSPMMTPSALTVRAAGRDAAQAAPEPAAAQAPEPEPVLVVSLSPDGTIGAAGRRFPGPGEFMAFVREELARRTDRKVFVAPHPDVPHGRVVHMLETLRYNGASSVALVQTEETQPPAAAPGPGAP
jgi:biopolymer transport protein ExbD